MKPEQFIRKQGLPEAKRILERAPEDATHWLDGIYYKENEYGVWSIWSDDEWHSSFRFPDGIMTKLPKQTKGASHE